MEYIGKKLKYLITLNNENPGIILIENNEKYKLVINSLNDIPQNIFEHLNIKSLEFISSSLIQSFDIQLINTILSNVPLPIPKIKFLVYFINNNLEKIHLPKIQTLSIKNIIYPNFNIFEFLDIQEIKTFKLDNYKFSSNIELKDFFNFIINKKIENLILNNIFIEILENSNLNNDDLNEYGIMNTYFEFNGNSISLNINDNIISSKIKSLTLNNCKLLYINIDNFSIEEGKIKIFCDKKSILNEEDTSIISFKLYDNILSITIDGQNKISDALLNILTKININSCTFINFYDDENLSKEIKLNCNSIKFKKCNLSFIKKILLNINNIINSLSIKDCFGDNQHFDFNNIQNLFYGNKLNFTLSDSNIGIPNINFIKLKLSYYELDKNELTNKQNVINILSKNEYDEIILEGNFYNIFEEMINNNFVFKSNKITLDNLILNNDKINTIYSIIKEKEITLLNMSHFLCSNKKTNLDYYTFNNYLYNKNEISDFENLVNNFYYEEEKKYEEKIKKIYNDIRIFYNKDFNFCFLVNNHIEFRNIILSLFCFFDVNTPTKDNIIDKLNNNFIQNENENIKILYEYYFTYNQRQFFNELNNISFKKMKK